MAAPSRTFNQPQVVLGLLATTEGLPVGYELFPGNQLEGNTLQAIIPKVKEKYNLKQVVFMADSAMLSRKNMEYLQENQVEYRVKTKRGEPMSIARIVNALNHIQQSILRDTATGKCYVLPSKVNEDAKQIYKSLNLATNTTSYELE